MMSLAVALFFAVALSEFDDYISQLKNRVELVWKYPKDSENLAATVKFNLNSLGQVSAIRITKSSGRDDFDSSVVEAVKRSSPFPRLPSRLVTASAAREVEMIFKRKPAGSD